MGEDKKGGNMSKIAGEINAEMMKTTGATQALTDRMVQEIESLRQQLADSQEECNALRRIHAENIAILTRETAQALAACKQKDESLEAAHNGLRWWMDAFPLHVTEADNEEMLKIVKALAIQSDDSALKDEWRFK